ncbi:unnamed protein product [Gongylonema pulchrum]|uniref:Cyclin N-terminal domain-containing protein n=1 Tax=Gongylonema pulchrum TaxID=637853 RepID=A0A183EKV3_9BILA|nr:unnamed protein product [Gongylonema pulchrum]
MSGREDSMDDASTDQIPETEPGAAEAKEEAWKRLVAAMNIIDDRFYFLTFCLVLAKASVLPGRGFLRDELALSLRQIRMHLIFTISCLLSEKSEQFFRDLGIFVDHQLQRYKFNCGFVAVADKEYPICGCA